MKTFPIVLATLFFAVGVQAQIVSHPKAKDVVKRSQRPRPVQQILPNVENEQLYERSARDLMYMPRAGDYIVESVFNYTLQAAIYQSNGIHIADLNQSAYKLRASLVGGITEFLAFSLKVAHGEGSAEIKNTSGSLTALKTAGFESPTVGATFLIYEQSPFKPVDVIMNVSYTPRFGNARQATSTKSGNNISTSDKVAANIDVIRKYDQYQIGAHLGFQPTSSGQSEDASTGDNLSISDPSIIELEASGQWLLTEQMFLTGGLSYLMYGASDSSTLTSKTTSDPFNLIGIRAGLKFMMNPRNTYLSGSMGYAMVPDYDSVISGTRIKIMNRNATIFLFGIAHTF